MTTGALIMMILGMGITWGGAGVCLYRVMKKQ